MCTLGSFWGSYSGKFWGLAPAYFKGLILWEHFGGLTLGIFWGLTLGIFLGSYTLGTSWGVLHSGNILGVVHSGSILEVLFWVYLGGFTLCKYFVGLTMGTWGLTLDIFGEYYTLETFWGVYSGNILGVLIWIHFGGLGNILGVLLREHFGGLFWVYFGNPTLGKHFGCFTLGIFLGGLLWEHFGGLTLGTFWGPYSGNILGVLLWEHFGGLTFWKYFVGSDYGNILRVLLWVYFGSLTLWKHFWGLLWEFWGSYSGYILLFCFCFLTAPLGEFQIKFITVTSDNIIYKRQVSGNSKPRLKVAASQEPQQLHILLTMLGESLKPTATQVEDFPSM